MHRWWGRTARSVVVVVIGAAAWVWLLPNSTVDTHRMALLAVRRSGIAGLSAKPATAEVLAASKSTDKAVRRAGKAHPAHTGIYEVGWSTPSKAKVQANAGLLIQLLPSSTLAAQVLGGEEHDYAVTRTLGGDTYRVTSHFAVPGVPDARGVVDDIAPSSPSTSNPAGAAEVVTFRVGRVAVLELLQTTGSAPGTAGVVRLARAELAAVRRAGPDPTLAVVTRPLSDVVGTAAGVVVVGAGVAVVPEWLSERRRRRAEERERRGAPNHYSAQGHRVVRRQQAPAWQRRQAQAKRRWTFWR